MVVMRRLHCDLIGWSTLEAIVLWASGLPLWGCLLVPFKASKTLFLLLLRLRGVGSQISLSVVYVCSAFTSLITLIHVLRPCISRLHHWEVFCVIFPVPGLHCQAAASSIFPQIRGSWPSIQHAPKPWRSFRSVRLSSQPSEGLQHCTDSRRRAGSCREESLPIMVQSTARFFPRGRGRLFLSGEGLRTMWSLDPERSGMTAVPHST